MVLQKVQHDKAACTLVIPEWKSAPFWPLIYTSKGIAHYIQDIEYLSGKRVIVKGAGKNGVFVKLPMKFRMLALKIDF